MHICVSLPIFTKKYKIIQMFPYVDKFLSKNYRKTLKLIRKIDPRRRLTGSPKRPGGWRRTG
jgi:hypothetical protein